MTPSEIDREIEAGRVWWEPYPHHTRPGKIRGLVSACAYWHDLARAYELELDRDRAEDRVASPGSLPGVPRAKWTLRRAIRGRSSRLLSGRVDT